MVCFEFMFDHRSYTHNLGSCEIITWKKSGMGSNPVQVWFFQALISQLLKLWSSLYSSTWIVLLTVRYPLDSDLWVNCPAFEQPMLIVTIDTNTSWIFGSGFKILYKDEGKEEEDEATNSVEDEKLDIQDLESKQHLLILLWYNFFINCSYKSLWL